MPHHAQLREAHFAWLHAEHCLQKAKLELVDGKPNKTPITEQYLYELEMRVKEARQQYDRAASAFSAVVPRKNV